MSACNCQPSGVAWGKGREGEGKGRGRKGRGGAVKS